LLSACVFFFSSRRRHTRFSRDWSSDVCSSDLPFEHRITPVVSCGSARRCTADSASCFRRAPAQATWHAAPLNGENPCARAAPPRSEERRVGKEGRTARSAEHGGPKAVDSKQAD